MTTIDRRRLLTRGAVAAGAATVASGSFIGLLARAGDGPDGPAGGSPASTDDGGYGPLVDMGDLWLPRGFRHMAFGEAGTALAMTRGGAPVGTLPRGHDGMASFAAGAGLARLVRNHENTEEVSPLGGGGYDPPVTAALDLETGIVYETEDRRISGDGTGSGFYRFTPTPGTVFGTAGRLEMLAVKGRPNYDTSTGQRIGEVLRVTWVPIADPDPADAATDSQAVFRQGWEQGAARFNRLEGAWYGDGSVFFISTNGGDPPRVPVGPGRAVQDEKARGAWGLGGVAGGCATHTWPVPSFGVRQNQPS